MGCSWVDMHMTLCFIMLHWPLFVAPRGGHMFRRIEPWSAHTICCGSLLLISTSQSDGRDWLEFNLTNCPRQILSFSLFLSFFCVMLLCKGSGYGALRSLGDGALQGLRVGEFAHHTETGNPFLCCSICFCLLEQEY